MIFGEGGDDAIDGDAGDDYISGGAGTDTLLGSDGNDVLVGGSGNDDLMGEAGNDALDCGGQASDDGDCGTGDDISNNSCDGSVTNCDINDSSYPDF